ncbi:family 43 glycosylhydrolase [Lactovum odontotermitis]
METIKNPIIPGMAPDPSIIRVGNKYYLATSTFHWQPAIQIFESDDLNNWSLADYALKGHRVNLKGTNTPAGIWAPHLSYDEATQTYWIAYSHMLNMAGREFNADSYVISARDIHGPWSEPIFLTAIGFDPAIYHENGKHYVSILEWETRSGYQSPGHIVIAEFDLKLGKLNGKWHRVTQGFTSRGCAEAPQIYKRGKYYYLLIAAGGTGYAHGVEVGRSESIFGPYVPHPSNEPIITSSPNHLFSLGDPDAGHFEMYNPGSPMQKAGHGSLVETESGEWYIAHLMSRPLKNTLLNPLGRETSIQKMSWTSEGWLEMADGSNLAKMETAGIKDSHGEALQTWDIDDDFSEEYDLRFMTPYREQNTSWVNTSERPGYLRIHGENSFFSQMNPSILATRATSMNYSVATKLEFKPGHYSETAGLGLYYDSNNWLYLHLTYSEENRNTILTILQAKLGQRIEFPYQKISIPEDDVKLKIIYKDGFVNLQYQREQDSDWMTFLENVDVTYLSDEGVNGEEGEIGGFTGLFNFIGSVDAHQRDSYADFDYYKVKNN